MIRQDIAGQMFDTSVFGASIAMQEYAMTEYSQNAQPHFNLLRILGGWGNVKFVNPRFGPHLVHASLTLLFL
ncbi:hypothetical protein CCHR01_02741 [Colletotrichum chrysophilum]|uniref:Uncharacterized protein n=1 Tax=Colletotrichum chrysophilum TaxID=1836956 RepID=A0AAD9AVH5_9PEZI|nr:hypothetical protein CCHR01_02741 [Colletotrichum chrysophilum]